MSHDPINWEVVEDDHGWSPSAVPSPDKPAEQVKTSVPAAPDAPLFSPEEVAKAKAATRAAAKATAKGAAVAATVGAKLATHAVRKSGEGMANLRAREWKRPAWLRLPHVRHPKRLARIGLALCAVVTLVGVGLGGFHIYRSHQGGTASGSADASTFTPDLSVGVPAEDAAPAPAADDLPAIELPEVSPVSVAPVSVPAFATSSAPVSLVPVAQPVLTAHATAPIVPAHVATTSPQRAAIKPAPVKHASPKPTPSKPHPTAAPSQAEQVDAWFHQLNH